jgi:hypothetical protein
LDERDEPELFDVSWPDDIPPLDEHQMSFLSAPDMTNTAQELPEKV